MENVEFDCSNWFNGLKIGDTVYYGYFYDPENFNPNKHVESGIVVELDDENYKVVIANVKSKDFIAIPHYCYNKAESKNYIDYQDCDTEHEDVAYMCYGTDKDKVRFQLSFKALSLIMEKCNKLKGRMQKLEGTISTLEKEIGAKLE